MNELERLLTEIGGELRYPRTPDMTGAVSERLRVSPAPRRPFAAPRSLVAGLAALLLLAAGAVAAVPATRDAVLRWLGLRSVQVVRVHRLPSLPSGGAGASLDLGQRTTLAGARSRVTFRVLVPTLAGAELYVSAVPMGGRVTFAYPPGRGLPRAPGTAVGALITEFRGWQPRGFIEKTVGPGTTVRFTTVNGEPAVWISGTPHHIVYLDADGKPIADTLRLAGNTLLWHHGNLLVRIEANVSEQAALRIARSLHSVNVRSRLDRVLVRAFHR